MINLEPMLWQYAKVSAFSKEENMKTPAKYTKNLQQGIITDEMLEMALFSVNKRAKNWRDKKREYRNINRYYRGYCRYDNSVKAEQEETAMYHRKEQLLSILKPVCIHREKAGYEKIRIYDYEQNFDEQYIDAMLRGQVVWTNSFWDYDLNDEIFFFDKVNLNKPKYRYYLYYVLGEHTFHTPITENKVRQYTLPVETINTLNTHGNEVQELISVQFVDKLIALIESGEYKFEHVEPEYIVGKTEESYENDNSDCFFDWDYIASKCQNVFKNRYSQTEKTYQLTIEEKKSIEQYMKKQYDKYKNKARKIMKKQKRIKQYNIPERANKYADIQIPYEQEIVEKIISMANEHRITIANIIDGLIEYFGAEYFEKQFAKQNAEHKYIKEIYKSQKEKSEKFIAEELLSI